LAGHYSQVREYKLDLLSSHGCLVTSLLLPFLLLLFFFLLFILLLRCRLLLQNDPSSSPSYTASYMTNRWCKPMLPSDGSLYDESEFVLPYLDSLEQLSCPDGHYNEVSDDDDDDDDDDGDSASPLSQPSCG